MHRCMKTKLKIAWPTVISGHTHRLGRNELTRRVEIGTQTRECNSSLHAGARTCKILEQSCSQSLMRKTDRIVTNLVNSLMRRLDQISLTDPTFPRFAFFLGANKTRMLYKYGPTFAKHEFYLNLLSHHLIHPPPLFSGIGSIPRDDRVQSEPRPQRLYVLDIFAKFYQDPHIPP
jgi:hypothetical protein